MTRLDAASPFSTIERCTLRVGGGAANAKALEPAAEATEEADETDEAEETEVTEQAGTVEPSGEEEPGKGQEGEDEDEDEGEDEGEAGDEGEDGDEDGDEGEDEAAEHDPLLAHLPQSDVCSVLCAWVRAGTSGLTPSVFWTVSTTCEGVQQHLALRAHSAELPQMRYVAQRAMCDGLYEASVTLASLLSLPDVAACVQRDGLAAVRGTLGPVVLAGPSAGPAQAPRPMRVAAFTLSGVESTFVALLAEPFVRYALDGAAHPYDALRGTAPQLATVGFLALPHSNAVPVAVRGWSQEDASEVEEQLGRRLWRLSPAGAGDHGGHGGHGGHGDHGDHGDRGDRGDHGGGKGGSEALAVDVMRATSPATAAGSALDALDCTLFYTMQRDSDALAGLRVALARVGESRMSVVVARQS